MGMRTLPWFVGVSFLSIACGGGEEGNQGGGLDSGGSGGSMSGQGGTAGTVVLGGTGGKGGSTQGGTGGGPECSMCENSLDGCVVITVTRGADTANQPWVLWPDEADGQGTLIAAAYPSVGAEGTVWRTLENADFTPAGASYVVDLGCVRGGQNFLGAFLDDDLDAAPNTVFSGDYIDSCPMQRQPIVDVPVGATLEYEFVLTNSCD